MPLVDPNKLWPKLDALGVDEVRKKLAAGAFGSWKRPAVEEWLRQAEKLPKPDTYMYHETEAPEGKLFHSSQVESLKRVGWVDNPALFGKGVRSKVKRFWSVVRGFLAKEWKWAVGILVAVGGVLAKCGV